MKNILLLVHDDTGQEARLQAALDITRALDGHLSCLDVALMPALPGDYFTADGTAMLLEEERTREVANRTRLEPRLRVEGIPYGWTEMTGDPSYCIKDSADLADLIVVNCKLERFPMPDMVGIAGDLITGSGKPILAVPEKARGFKTGGRALVAWDGSAEAAEALRAAVPLLALASEVVIFAVDDGSLNLSPEDGATYLSRHGIHPTIECVAGRRGSAGAAILDAIDDRKADYVVMGGFGHSRIAETILGGVTRRMLCESPVPVFFAH